MKHIFVCSPFRNADPEIQRKNIRIAKALCRRIALEEMKFHARNIPFAPHLLYPQFLCEETERKVGMNCAADFIREWAEEFWYYPPELTEGMQQEISIALNVRGLRIHPIPLDYLNDAGSREYLKRLEEEDAHSSRVFSIPQGG